MRLFSLTKEIAIDLGTANTIIIHNDKIVINEPSIVALDNRTEIHCNEIAFFNFLIRRHTVGL